MLSILGQPNFPAVNTNARWCLNGQGNPVAEHLHTRTITFLPITISSPTFAKGPTWHILPMMVLKSMRLGWFCRLGESLHTDNDAIDDGIDQRFNVVIGFLARSTLRLQLDQLRQTTPLNIRPMCAGLCGWNEPSCMPRSKTAVSIFNTRGECFVVSRYLDLSLSIGESGPYA